MIKALIVDDEPLARSELKRFLQWESDFEVAGEAANGEEAIVFLDIHFPGLIGLDVAHILSEFQTPPVVVFVTAYDQYAIQAFEANALDYILKPYDEIRFKKACARVRQALSSQSQSKERLDSLKSYLEGGKPLKILGHKRNSRDRVFIHPNEVLYFHVELTEVTAHLTNGEEFLVNATLKALFDMLDPTKFQQTNRAFVVNLDHVEKVSPLFNGNFELILKNAAREPIPLSRRYASKLRKFLKW
jgi:two-component system LytT family response regulator/two-component system response regulator LytT